MIEADSKTFWSLPFFVTIPEYRNDGYFFHILP